MTDIKSAFQNGKAFIPFVTAGDPDLETTEKLLIEMSKKRCRYHRNRYSVFRPDCRGCCNSGG